MSSIAPYGDTANDGVVQLAFTLPMAHGARAIEAARVLTRRMGFERADVVHAVGIGEGFTFVIVYARSSVLRVDAADIVLRELDIEALKFSDLNQMIQQEFGRRLVVVGACIGSDTHTVGIDAIMTIKGYHGHLGLEAYPQVEAHNCGSQVAAEALITQAIAVRADAVLVSQVVTQKDLHVKTLTEFVELAEGFGVRDRMVLIAGGPSITNALALELGFDAGFGRGSYAEHVLTFIVRKLIERRRAGIPLQEGA